MGILDLVFPKKCLGCGKERVYICSDCVAKVKLARPICAYCEKPSIDGLTHIKCLRKNGLDGLISIWEYEGVIRKAILALKYKYATAIGTELQSYIVTELRTKPLPNAQCLVAVPLHWYRENFRGFNQSDLIGKTVAEAVDWKFIPDLLVRKKSTTPQVQLKGNERRHNLRGVFELNSIYSLSTNRYPLVLFDDVFTTGSTLKEATKVLKRAGVQKVWGLAIAR